MIRFVQFGGGCFRIVDCPWLSDPPPAVFRRQLDSVLVRPKALGEAGLRGPAPEWRGSTQFQAADLQASTAAFSRPVCLARAWSGCSVPRTPPHLDGLVLQSNTHQPLFHSSLFLHSRSNLRRRFRDFGISGWLDRVALSPSPCLLGPPLSFLAVLSHIFDLFPSLCPPLLVTSS